MFYSMIKKWDIIKSASTHKDRWLTVRSDTCRRQDGKIIAPYHVLEYSDWVNVVPVTVDYRVILARQYRHGAGIISLELPSGGMDGSDVSLESAARRELVEETGYDGGNFYHVGSSYANPANQTNLVHSFLAVGVKKTHEQALDGSEEIEIVSLPFRDVMAGQHGNKGDCTIVQSLHLATLHLVCNYLLNSTDQRLQPLRGALLESVTIGASV